MTETTTGAKSPLGLDDLRGAEAPLFHGDICIPDKEYIREFFRSLGRHAKGTLTPVFPSRYCALRRAFE
jgi:hypothetical protein